MAKKYEAVITLSEEMHTHVWGVPMEEVAEIHEDIECMELLDGIQYTITSLRGMVAFLENVDFHGMYNMITNGEV